MRLFEYLQLKIPNYFEVKVVSNSNDFCINKKARKNRFVRTFRRQNNKKC